MYLVRRLQSVMSRYEHVTLLLRQLHWLKAPQRVDFKLAVLHTDVCMVWYRPISLMNSTWRWSLTLVNFIYGSATSSSLIVRRTRISTVGDRVFPVASARGWNGLPRSALHVGIIIHFAWVVDHEKCIVVTRVCVCVCVSVRGRMSTLLHGPGCNLEEW